MKLVKQIIFILHFICAVTTVIVPTQDELINRYYNPLYNFLPPPSPGEWQQPNLPFLYYSPWSFTAHSPPVNYYSNQSPSNPVNSNNFLFKSGDTNYLDIQGIFSYYKLDFMHFHNLELLN